MKPNENISFLPGLLFIAALALVVIFSTTLLVPFTQTRQKTLAQKFTQETQAHIQQNPQGYKQLFTDIMDRAARCSPTETPDCNNSIVSSIKAIIPPSLDNFSGTFFIRLSTNQLDKLFLSGELRLETYGYTDRWQTINDLLTGRITSAHPNDYFPDFPGLEVIIPVKLDNRIIGAIVRRVIE